MSDADLIFYHAPGTRASSVLALLEELDAPYTLCDLNLRVGAQRRPEYLAVNPMGKVPAIVHKGALVTELGAIFIYLADAFPQHGLAPPIGDTLRGPWLRWLVFYGSSFEPAVLDAFTDRPPMSSGMSPYGDFDRVMHTLTDQLKLGPFLLGSRFTAADTLWGMNLRMMAGFGVFRPSPEIAAYIERVCARAAIARVIETDAQLQKIHEAAARG
jgi:glutathione S-transferase